MGDFGGVVDDSDSLGVVGVVDDSDSVDVVGVMYTVEGVPGGEYQQSVVTSKPLSRLLALSISARDKWLNRETEIFWAFLENNLVDQWSNTNYLIKNLRWSCGVIDEVVVLGPSHLLFDVLKTSKIFRLSWTKW